MGRNDGCEQASMPLSPSMQTSRTFAAVGETMATRLQRPLSTCARTHSLPHRVLPNPRPANTSQTRQSPGGGNWLGRAHADQSCKRHSASIGLSAFIMRSRFAGSRLASRIDSGSERLKVADAKPLPTLNNVAMGTYRAQVAGPIRTPGHNRLNVVYLFRRRAANPTPVPPKWICAIAPAVWCSAHEHSDV